MLWDRKGVVRVFIHAPKDYRVRKVIGMYGDSGQEGRKSIARSDAACALFLLHLFCGQAYTENRPRYL